MRLDSRDAVREGLARFLESIISGAARTPRSEAVVGYSREARTAELAALLEDAVSDGGRA